MSNQGISDFRSDTVTRPDAAMRRAMAEAVVGDDVFGDDPTVGDLEARGAALFGKEAAVLVPSGTMANQAAIRCHTDRGDELLCERHSHIFLHEQGGAAALHGVQAVPVAGDRGMIPVESLREHVRTRDQHHPVTSLVCLENTHNNSGGHPLPVSYLDEVGAFVAERGLRLHVDGARLLNAAVALGVEPARLVRDAHSLTLCLSKGLGAPVGTLLMGDDPFIEKARRVRKLLGGGMRQAGVLAAPALLSLGDWRERLSEDHRRARSLVEGISALEGVAVEPPGSNIVVVRLSGRRSGPVVKGLASHGVRAFPLDSERVRLCTHRDVDDEDVRRAVGAFEHVVNEGET